MKLTKKDVLPCVWNKVMKLREDVAKNKITRMEANLKIDTFKFLQQSNLEMVDSRTKEEIENQRKIDKQNNIVSMALTGLFGVFFYGGIYGLHNSFEENNKYKSNLRMEEFNINNGRINDLTGDITKLKFNLMQNNCADHTDSAICVETKNIIQKKQRKIEDAKHEASLIRMRLEK